MGSTRSLRKQSLPVLKHSTDWGNNRMPPPHLGSELLGLQERAPSTVRGAGQCWAQGMVPQPWSHSPIWEGLHGAACSPGAPARTDACQANPDPTNPSRGAHLPFTRSCTALRVCPAVLEAVQTYSPWSWGLQYSTFRMK